MQLEPGTFVLDGRFKVRGPLASGGMGDVYVAEQVSLGRPVALKVLKPDMAGVHKMTERFRQEAALLAQVEHPSVVRILDFGEHQGALCLVLERIEGTPLNVLLRQGAMTPDRVVPLLVQLLEGLAAIHARGIVHRDLTPKNVMVTQTPLGEKARLLDFGIARLLEPPEGHESDSPLTMQGTVVGTPEYMAPERLQSTTPHPASDLYSLGVLAYEMLSARLPFPGPDSLDYLKQHLKMPPRQLADVAPHLRDHGSLCALVMKCLEKKTENRPESALALASRFLALPNLGDPTMLSETLGPIVPADPSTGERLSDEMPTQRSKPGASVASEHTVRARSFPSLPLPREPGFAGSLSGAAIPKAEPRFAFPGAPGNESSPPLPPTDSSDERTEHVEILASPGSAPASNAADFGSISVRESARHSAKGAPPPLPSTPSLRASGRMEPVADFGDLSSIAEGKPGLGPSAHRADAAYEDLTGRAFPTPSRPPRRPTLEGQLETKAGLPIDPAMSFELHTPASGSELPTTRGGETVGTEVDPNAPTRANFTLPPPQPIPPRGLYPAAPPASAPRGLSIGLKVAGAAAAIFVFVAAMAVLRWSLSDAAYDEARALLEGKEDKAALELIDERLTSTKGEKRQRWEGLRSVALHRLNRHREERKLQLAIGREAPVWQEPLVLSALVEDLGNKDETEGRALLESLPRHETDELLAQFLDTSEVPSARHWASLRQLDRHKALEEERLRREYTRALAAKPCGVKAASAARLGDLGAFEAKEALLAIRRSKTPAGCAQSEAGLALKKLERQSANP